MKVSVIIPVYNVSGYIERCIQSIICQTFTDVECVIVDDATEDDSIEKCERLIEEYNDNVNLNLNDNLAIDHNVNGRIRFKILHHEENRGLSAARNTGIDAASGEYIYFLDADDEIKPDCIEKLIKKAEEYPEIELVVGNHKRIVNTKEKLGIDSGVPSLIKGNDEIMAYFHQKRIPLSAWNKLIRRSFIGEHNLLFREGIIAEDTLWNFYLLKYLSAVAVVNDVTYYYYLRPDGITLASDDYTIGRSYWVVYDEILHNLTPGHESVELKRYVDGFCYEYFRNKAAKPEDMKFKELYCLYRNLANQYGCKYATVVLNITGYTGRFGNPMKTLRALKALRRRIKKMF